ncbi:MAG TPA: DNA translocase FtsK [Clostridia bacterium]|nr:DNA translocase FtsK [Clostridia bacterium]
MATVKSRKKQKKSIKQKDEKKHLILPIVMIAAGIMLLLSIYTESAGILGAWVKNIFGGLFNGNVVYMAFILILSGVLQVIERGGSYRSIFVLADFMVSGSILYGITNGISRNFEVKETVVYFAKGVSGEAPGLINRMIYSASVKMLGTYGSLFLSAILLLIGTAIILDKSIAEIVKAVAGGLKLFLSMLKKSALKIFTKDELEYKERKKKKEKVEKLEKEAPKEIREEIKRQSSIKVIDYAKEYGGRKENIENVKAEEKTGIKDGSESKIQNDSISEPIKLNSEINKPGVSENYRQYRLPDMKLLDKTPEIGKEMDKKSVLKKAKNLERILDDFGVDAKVIQVSRGPTITRYEIQPKPGVKVSRIVSLSDDIALNLAARNIRIEAPIPGKAAVGIEVPNDGNSLVGLREIINSNNFKEKKEGLNFALGKDISGNPIVSDLTEMPHLLIAGATGSGKSVCVNALITSLLFAKRPDEVKFLMIDPKVVELNQYNGIPHLIMPVVTDPQKSASALNWIVNEMNERYKIFAETNVRDIKSYNKSRDHESMYQIVVIIDELSDLMMVAPSQVEDAICRIAQMARAAGIHLIVATQRPSVDVITGIIKANIPSRIAFAVSSQADSRTILDMGGAEKLLGKGDMLHYPVGQSKPRRIQGVFVSDSETKRVLNHIKSQVDEVEYEEIPAETFVKDNVDETDELLPEIVETVAAMEQISISMLQRRYRIGYNRAARIIDELENRGIVSKSDGKKPRNVLINEEDLGTDYE